MTIKPSFMYRVWENIRVTLEEVRAEFNSELPKELSDYEIADVCYGEIVTGRPASYIMLSDVRGESGQGFRFSYATNRGGPTNRGSMTRDAKGILVVDILIYTKDSRKPLKFTNPTTGKKNLVRVGGRQAYDLGWRVFEIFERKMGKDVTLGFPEPGTVLANDNKKDIQVTQAEEDIRYLNYEIDEVYQNIDLSEFENSDRFFNINVRVSVNARLDSII